jgi:hypothetical protein
METIKDSHTTIAAMKDAAKTLKVEHQKIDLNEIEDLNDDLADMFEDMNEISEVSIFCYKYIIYVYICVYIINSMFCVVNSFVWLLCIDIGSLIWNP